MTGVAATIARRVGGTWKAVRSGFGWEYECDDGRTARWYAEIGGYCGDDYLGASLYVHSTDGSPMQFVTTRSTP